MRNRETPAVRDWTLGRTYPSNSGTVAWERFGEPDAPPVVLLHGTPFSSFVWRDIAAALAHDHRVYVWDMPGYGQSEKAPGSDLSLPALGRIFAELLQHWGLSRPAVVAHDTGGGVALDAHVTHGARYDRLALVDAVALSPWGSPFFRAIDGHTEVFAGLPGTLHEALMREYLNLASGPGLHPATLDGLLAPWLGTDGQAAFYRQLAHRGADEPYTDRIKDGYPAITIPVRLFWGTRDTWIPVERARELTELIDGCRLRMLPGAGHLSPVDNPAALTAGLVDFLR